MLRHASATVRGHRHARNEDRLVVAPSVGLFAVSDGMGSTGRGAHAAQLVVDGLVELAGQVGPGIDEPAADVLATGIAALSARVRDAFGDERTPGATALAVLVRGSRLLLAHVGDSRAYLLRERTLRRLTRDHSVAEHLVSTGVLTDREAFYHAGRGELTRFMGMPGTAVADVSVHELGPGERVLLCSDGLPAALPDTEIHALLSSPDGPVTTVTRLVDAVNTTVSPDDTSVVLLDREDS